MIRLFLDGEINEAGAMLYDNNPMSVFCSLVCDHDAQCEGNCIQGRRGAPVQISSIEHYISDTYLDKLVLERKSYNGHNVAVIGAGPAGIVVAVKLAQEGYGVTIFERMQRIGGMLRYGIPDFRLPPSTLDRYEEKLYTLGIHIRPNTTIGGALTVDDLFRDGYETIFMGTGAWRAKSLGIHGETLGNCHFAVNYLQWMSHVRRSARAADMSRSTPDETGSRRASASSSMLSWTAVRSNTARASTPLRPRGRCCMTVFLMRSKI